MSFHAEWRPFQSREMQLPTVLLLQAYNTLLTSSWPFLFLYFRLRAVLDGKYARSYRQRLGIEIPRFGKSRARIWFHALSVGEVLSVVPLVQVLKELDPSIEVAFSTATETGQATARSRLSQWVDHFFHLPLDFPWAVGKLISQMNPSFFILTETDIWPNLLFGLKRRVIPCLLVNGRISPRSFDKLARLKQFTAPMFTLLDGVYAQSAEDKARYEQLGIPADRVIAAGNLKVDSVLPPLTEMEILELGRSIGLEPGRPVWIAGSTHEGEEEILLQVHAMLRSENPDVLLIIAPRDVSRAGGLASLCARHGAPAALRSSSRLVPGKSVYILDTIGELSRFYALADIAFIGGSLVPFGGHNPLEATSQGKFAVWGPHLFNFRQMEAAMTAAHCGAKVSSAVELGEVVGRFVSDPRLRDSARERARRFMENQEGPAKRIARTILRSMTMGSKGC